MWSWFGLKQQSVIGMDIQPHQVYIVSLCYQKKQPKLQQYARVSYEVEADLPQALRTAWAMHRFSSKTVAIAVPTTQVSTHLFTAPAGLSVELLELRVHREMRRFFPAIDLQYIDFEVRPLSRADQVEIFVVASMRDPIDRRIALLHGAGLHVVAVDIDTVVLERAFIYMDKNAWEAVWYKDPGGVQFTVLHQGQIYYARDYQATVEVTQALALFSDAHPEISIVRLILAGQERTLEAESLSAALAMPVVWADPFSKMMRAPDSEPVQIAPALLRATGLALHGGLQ